MLALLAAMIGFLCCITYTQQLTVCITQGLSCTAWLLSCITIARSGIKHAWHVARSNGVPYLAIVITALDTSSA
jgi:hypothetical protein